MGPSALCVLSIFSALLAFANAEPPASDEYFLAEVATPISYDIFVDPRPNSQDNFTFSGTVSITFIATQNVKYFELNVSPTIDIYDDNYPTEVRRGGEDGEVINLTDMLQDAETEILRVMLEERLIPGEKYVFSTPFKGALRRDMLGLYLSSYSSDQGNPRYVAATQFEATYARSAWPCWDEPKYKAVVNLVVQRDQNQITTSNMPLKYTSPPISGRVNDTFETTPPISSYLVAFVVSNFENLTNDAGNFSVWGPPDNLGQMAYALDYGQRSLATVANSIKYPFMLPKMDMVAIPDFNAGAMENWGMITFREADILFQEGESSEYDRRYIATVITHEQSHQWFGDLVSPAWWRYAWLNEAIANFYEVMGTNMVEPSWDLVVLFPSMCNQYAFPYEALPSARPMSSSVYAMNDIENVFDTTIYQAGAAKIRMFASMLGPTKFWGAMNTYLEQMSYGPVKEEDLADAYNNVAEGLPATFPEIMKGWTEQAGYPVVTVTRNEQNNSLSLCQQRHYSVPPSTISTSPEAWWIPLTWTTQAEANFDESNLAPRGWLSPTEPLIIDDIPGTKDGWFIFNLQSVGFYRVNYDFFEWQRLACALTTDKNIHPVNRGVLLNDALSLASSGYLSYNLALPVTQFLENETDPVPWNSAYPHFDFLNRLVDAGTEANEFFYAYIRKITANIFNELGFTPVENERQLATITRGQIARYACAVNNPDCVREANNAFNALRRSRIPVVPDLRYAVYCTAVKGENAEDNWNFLWDRYARTRIATEKAVIQQALACTDEVGILEEYLTETLTGETIRPQDASLVFSNVVSQGRNGTVTALNFLDDNFADVALVYGPTGMGRVFSSLGNSVVTQDLLDKLQEVVAENWATLTEIGQTGAANNAITSAAANVQWRTSYIPTVIDWFRVHSFNDPCPPAGYWN